MNDDEIARNEQSDSEDEDEREGEDSRQPYFSPVHAFRVTISREGPHRITNSIKSTKRAIRREMKGRQGAEAEM